MPNLKCKACGLVNFASAQTCKRCETPLLEQSAPTSVESAPHVSQAGAPKDGADFSRILPKPETFNGIGVDLRGYRQLSADTYQVTRFFTILYIPLIPISTWVIRPLTRELSALTTSEKFSFELLEDKGLELNDVLRVYGGFLLWVVLAFGPFALGLMLLSRHEVERDIYGEPLPMNITAGKIINSILFMLTMPWSFGLLIWLKRRRDRIYTLTKKSWFARMLGVR
jgi:hypothetical protein